MIGLDSSSPVDRSSRRHGASLACAADCHTAVTADQTPATKRSARGRSSAIAASTPDRAHGAGCASWAVQTTRPKYTRMVRPAPTAAGGRRTGACRRRLPGPWPRLRADVRADDLVTRAFPPELVDDVFGSGGPPAGRPVVRRWTMRERRTSGRWSRARQGSSPPSRRGSCPRRRPRWRRPPPAPWPRRCRRRAGARARLGRWPRPTQRLARRPALRECRLRRGGEHGLPGTALSHAQTGMTSTRTPAARRRARGLAAARRHWHCRRR